MRRSSAWVVFRMNSTSMRLKGDALGRLGTEKKLRHTGINGTTARSW